MWTARIPIGLAFVWLLCGAVACGGGDGGDGVEQRGDHLVSTDWLAEQADDPGLVIIDARPTDDYLEGHLPGAVSASFSEQEATSHGVDTSYGGGLDYFLDEDNPIPFQDGPPEQIQQVVRSFGIDDDSTVVVYDLGPAFDAARFFSTLEYHGFEDIHLLDGGITKWQAEDRPTTQAIPEVEPGDFTASVPEPQIRVDTTYVLRALDDPDKVAITSLTPAWYYGSHLAYSEAGHIPKSKLIPLAYFFEPDGTWKSADGLRPLVEVVGIDQEQEMITYCGGGPLSAATYYALKYLADYPRVRNYQGSVVAWLHDDRGLELHSYQHPEMLRDAQWIHWWAGDRIQHLFTDPPALTVDVRPAADYEPEHIPWSVNVPLTGPDTITGQGPDAWANDLGAKGVGAEMETVICDAGIRPTTALFFWLLEYLGHPEVSLCRDGVAGWEDAGFELTAEATIIDEPQDPIDVAVHPKDFAAQPQSALRLTSADQARIDDRFARSWLVLAEEVPEAVPADEYAHLPWEQLLTEDGRLQTAAALYTALDEAGVHRFSEIVCYSDQPAEAAVGYLALRLLGYPLVRLYLPEADAL